MLKKGPVNIAHSSWIMRKHLVQWRGKKKTVTLCPSWELKRQNTKMSSYLHFVLPQHSQAFLELSVFLGWEFCNNVLQLSFCFTLREVTHLVVLRGNFHQPGKEGKSTVTNCLPCFLVGKKKKQNKKYVLPYSRGDRWSKHTTNLEHNCTRSHRGNRNS